MANAQGQGPDVLIVHAHADSGRAIALSDGLRAQGINAVPFARILATQKLFDSVVTGWLLTSDATLLVVSAESFGDESFRRSVAVARKYLQIKALRIGAIRIGDVDVPSPVMNGYVSATWSHFESKQGVDALIVALNDLFQDGRREMVAPGVVATYESTSSGDLSAGTEDMAQLASLLKPRTPRIVAEVFADTGLAISVMIASLAYAGILAVRGLLDEYWWQPAAALVGLALSRAWGLAARGEATALATSAHPSSRDVSEPAPRRALSEWAPKLAGIVGGCAAVITALVQGGSVASQHALAKQRDSEKVEQDRRKDQVTHQAKLTETTERYLTYALNNASYSRRLTLLSFLSTMAPAKDTKVSGTELSLASGLADWAKAEMSRLSQEQALLQGLLEALVRDCEQKKELCKPGAAHTQSIVRIVREVGPEGLTEERATRVAKLGIPIADVSEADPLMVGTAARVTGKVTQGGPLEVVAEGESSPTQ